MGKKKKKKGQDETIARRGKQVKKRMFSREEAAGQEPEEGKRLRKQQIRG